MADPVPPKPEIREIKFVCREMPERFRQERLMKTWDFLTELDNRLPLKARVNVLKHAAPDLGDYETLIHIHPGTEVFRLINDGIHQPTWNVAGHVSQ